MRSRTVLNPHLEASLPREHQRDGTQVSPDYSPVQIDVDFISALIRVEDLTRIDVI